MVPKRIEAHLEALKGRDLKRT